MNELAGKVAIVTGASKGIGAAIARQFAKAGAAVVVNYASSRVDADRVVGEIIRDGGKAVAIQADVGKSADVKRLFAETRNALGTPSILVNNAGVFSFGPIEAVTEDEFHRQFDTNVLGSILATQEAVEAFGDGGGSVINFSSISSANPVPNSVVYSASKSAVDAITKALANELAGRKIRVNAIAPGMTVDRRPDGDGRQQGGRKAARGERADGPARAARRHCSRRSVPGLRSIRLVDGRAHHRFRRTALGFRRQTLLGARRTVVRSGAAIRAASGLRAASGSARSRSGGCAWRA